MNQKTNITSHIMFILKDMLFAYLLTAIFLLLLAFLLYRFALSEKIVSVAITVIYVLITFLAGMIAGKHADKRRFLWGLIVGILYFVILTIVSLTVNHGVTELSTHMLTVFILCAGSGMLGAMLS